VKVNELNLNHWSLESVWDAVDSTSEVVLSEEAKQAVVECRKYLEKRLDDSSEPTIYGVNTGFGDLAHTRVNSDQLSELQRNLLISHACGVGDDVPEQIVKAMLLLKVKALSKGHSGIQLQTIQRLIDHLNERVFPVIPSQGSLGASGDLAPLAHMVLPLIGEGEVKIDGVPVPAVDVLAAKGWSPLKLGAKEGLALINGTQLMLGYGVMAIKRMERIAQWADALCAWSLEAWMGRPEPFEACIHQVRNQAGAELVAGNVRQWLEGSEWQKKPRQQVQDPYSFRCTPQVHGASRNSLLAARTVFENEVNAVTDNPLIFPELDQILSGGNFHGQPLALHLDALALAAHEWGSISERRTFKLLSGKQGLPAFLSSNPGLNSGLMIAQYTSASLVSQNKQLCTPSSSDTIDSSNGQEDHVSMGANGALKLWKVLDNVEQVLAVECLTAAQATSLRNEPEWPRGCSNCKRPFGQLFHFRGPMFFLQPQMLAAREWMFSQDLDS
jgi:histidine ammonia-lyase